MVTRWSHSTSNFCALIGQNLTGEFMGKIYAASWNLFTLTAKAYRVLCQRVIFLTVLFIGFWLRNASLVKVGNPISDDIVFVFHRSWCVRGLKSLERFWPYLIALRSSIRNGKPEYLLYLMFVFSLSNFMKSSVVYAAYASICTFVRSDTMI